MKKITPGDWALILTAVCGALGTLIAVSFMVAGVKASVEAAGTANAETNARVSEYKLSSESRDNAIFGELRDMNTRLSRMEGGQERIERKLEP